VNKMVKKGRNRLVREVKWRSANGAWVVVCGPFPSGVPRSETRDTPEKAAKLYSQDVLSRPETTKADHYAKVHASDVMEVQGGANEFGPVSP
jgi:hypothetical protein